MTSTNVVAVVKGDDPRRAAQTLAKHSFWMGLGFCSVIVIGVGIEKFGELLVWLRWVKTGDLIYWACVLGQDLLVVGDVVLLLAIFFKLGYRFYRSHV